MCCSESSNAVNSLFFPIVVINSTLDTSGVCCLLVVHYSTLVLCAQCCMGAHGCTLAWAFTQHMHTSKLRIFVSLHSYMNNDKDKHKTSYQHYWILTAIAASNPSLLCWDRSCTLFLNISNCLQIVAYGIKHNCNINLYL